MSLIEGKLYFLDDFYKKRDCISWYLCSGRKILAFKAGYRKRDRNEKYC
mgnify:CR=1 FL=1